MKQLFIGCSLVCLFCAVVACQQKESVSVGEVLFDGSSLDAWDFPENGWYVDESGALTCRMQETTDKKGKKKMRGMGNIMSKQSFDSFELSLSYKLSDGANSGIFYWADPKDPVGKGFEIQLMDNEGFQRDYGPRDARKLNGTFYDGAPALANPANPVGQWDQLVLRCEGSKVKVTINGVTTADVDVAEWTEVGKNPDGSPNKFIDALATRPRSGSLGLQNHGQQVWFKDIVIREL